jgi:hypothetical protein
MVTQIAKSSSAYGNYSAANIDEYTGIFFRKLAYSGTCKNVLDDVYQFASEIVCLYRHYQILFKSIIYGT